MQSFQFKRYGRWLALAIIIMGVGAVVHVLSAPVHGRPVKSDATLQLKHVAKPAVLPASTLQNSYFQLALPAGYRQQPGSQTVPGLLYSQTLIKPSSFGSLIINIGVKALPEGGLSEDSSYRLRVEQSARFQLSSQTFDGEAVQIANDSQSAAVAAFWPHGGYLATISVTSGISDPGADDNVDQLAALRPLLQAWQWQ